jgi:molybdate transport system substrate-binding protein
MNILKYSALFLGMLLWAGCEPAKPPPAPSTGSSVKQSQPAESTVAKPDESTVAKPADSAAAKPASTGSKQIVLAAASDLRFVMTDLLQEFHKKFPEIEVKSTFGSSGTLFAQISNQGPFDVFLSADLQYPVKLAEQGLTTPDSLFRYAIGHIVLWVRKDSPLDVEAEGIKVLADPRVKKVAIANPKLAPYGRAAEAALKKLEVYDAIQDKLVLGENIAQTAQFAESGAADVAVIALSLAVAPAYADKGKYWMIPEDAYPQLEQGGVVLKNSKQQAAAKTFCEFLQSPEARVIFKKYGFVLPETK